MDTTRNKAAGGVGRSYRLGQIAAMLAVVAVIWYLLAEFVFWGSARTADQQPPAFAWFTFLALAFGTLVAGLVGLVLGVIARGRAATDRQRQLATASLALSAAGLAILIIFVAVVVPRIEG